VEAVRVEEKLLFARKEKGKGKGKRVVLTAYLVGMTISKFVLFTKFCHGVCQMIVLFENAKQLRFQ
jgi:hypothetical protein